MKLPVIPPFAALLSAVALASASCASNEAKPDAPAAAPAVEKKEDIQPEEGTGLREVPLARASQHMVAAAHPDAALAGLTVLERGGTALDAAVAVQAMLTLVEPQSSGIGGGAFLLYWDAANNELFAYDGREMAPAAAKPAQFLDESGEPLPFFDAVVGGRSVGAPGVVRMLALAHETHGKLSWAELFAPAIARAETGFVVGPRLHKFLDWDTHVRKFPAAREYFYDEEGEPRPVGHLLQNPELAATLRTIAREGAKGFYEGEIAQAIVDAVQNAPVAPGALSLADLKGYQAKRREPVCVDVFERRACGMPPPTSGGVTSLQILALYERAVKAAGTAPAPASPEAWHLFAEAGRIAFADRDTYLADADFVDVPVAGLLDPTYLDERARLIRSDAVLGEAEPGSPPGAGATSWAPDASPELPSTSHFSIVDASGNAVAVTTSVENLFGSRVMVRGFFLNNQLTDFSFRPTDDDGKPIANALAPGKRPRSSMSPTMVLAPGGGPELVVGSPGGSRIIGYNAATVLAVVAWGMNVQQAISLPKVNNRNGKTSVESTGRTPEELAALTAALEALGHEVSAGDMNSGLHGIALTDDGLEGGADPRREGVAAGH